MTHIAKLFRMSSASLGIRFKATITQATMRAATGVKATAYQMLISICSSLLMIRPMGSISMGF